MDTSAARASLLTWKLSAVVCVAGLCGKRARFSGRSRQLAGTRGANPSHGSVTRNAAVLQKNLPPNRRIVRPPALSGLPRFARVLTGARGGGRRRGYKIRRSCRFPEPAPLVTRERPNHSL